MEINKYKFYKDFNLLTKSYDKFDSEYLKITKYCITVKKGFEWDGCSPKIRLFGKIIGVPDGFKNSETGLPKTYYASCIHDAIYRYKNRIPVTRKQADIMFLIQLQRDGFRCANLYYFFVRKLGWLYGSWLVK